MPNLDAIFKPLTAQEKEYAGQQYQKEEKQHKGADDWQAWDNPPSFACRPADAGDCPFLPYPMPRPWKGYSFKAWYCYTDEMGEPLYFIVRMVSKEGGKITPPLAYGTFKGKDGWFWKSPKKRVLFRLHELETPLFPNMPILVCEGEKDTLAAQKLFGGVYQCTTSGGATSAGSVEWHILKGRHLIIWPDPDEAGKKYAQDVTEKAWDVGALSVSILPTSPIFKQ